MFARLRPERVPERVPIPESPDTQSLRSYAERQASFGVKCDDGVPDVGVQDSLPPISSRYSFICLFLGAQDIFFYRNFPGLISRFAFFPSHNNTTEKCVCSLVLDAMSRIRTWGVQTTSPLSGFFVVFIFLRFHHIHPIFFFFSIIFVFYYIYPTSIFPSCIFSLGPQGSALRPLRPHSLSPPPLWPPVSSPRSPRRPRMPSVPRGAPTPRGKGWGGAGLYGNQPQFFRVFFFAFSTPKTSPHP